ncbi:MAG: 3-deoxy-D-manno-octulosonic acid transferase, partial [Magnetospiraceae bacterium]
PHVLALGNLKFAAPPLPADPGMLSDLKTRKGSRPCWIAASTHDGEERLAAGLHKLIAQDLPNLLTVIVPRHPERGDAIAREVREAGLRVALRSKGQPLEDGAEVYIADTIGELGLFFRLADVVFMGKSLVPMGGQNPLEPARLGKPVLFGPHMANFEEIAQRMVDAGAARQVTGENGLLEALQ